VVETPSPKQQLQPVPLEQSPPPPRVFTPEGGNLFVRWNVFLLLKRDHLLLDKYITSCRLIVNKEIRMTWCRPLEVQAAHWTINFKQAIYWSLFSVPGWLYDRNRLFNSITLYICICWPMHVNSSWIGLIPSHAHPESWKNMVCIGPHTLPSLSNICDKIVSKL
jgi:hypothetical protein